MTIPAVYDRVKLGDKIGTMVFLDADGMASVIWDDGTNGSYKHLDLEDIGGPKSLDNCELPCELRAVDPYTPDKDDYVIGLYDDGFVRVATKGYKIVRMKPYPP